MTENPVSPVSPMSPTDLGTGGHPEFRSDLIELGRTRSDPVGPGWTKSDTVVGQVAVWCR